MTNDPIWNLTNNIINICQTQLCTPDNLVHDIKWHKNLVFVFVFLVYDTKVYENKSTLIFSVGLYSPFASTLSHAGHDHVHEINIFIF